MFGTPRFGIVAIVSLVVGICASFARGADEVRVDIHFDNLSVTTLLYDSGEAISLAPLNTWDHVNIWCPNGGQSTYHVGPITLTGTSLSTPLDIILGSASWSGQNTAKTTACQDFGGITCQNSSIEQYIHFEGKAGDDLTGPVRVGSIYRFDVGGTVSAEIESTTSNGAASFYCVIGDVSSSGSFTAEAGSILRVEATGDCLGDIEAPNGNVALVTVGGDLAGNMTAGTHFTRIEVGGDLLGDVQAGVEIKEIEVDGNIGSAANNSAITTVKQIGSIIANRMWADISVLNSAMPTIEGWLGHIETTGGANGHFSGSLEARLVTLVTFTPSETYSDIVIDGDFNGTLDLSSGGVLRPITIADDMTGTMELGTIAAAGTLDGYLRIGGNVSGDVVTKRLDDSDSIIEILGSLSTQGSIIFNDSAPILGQVIINSANTSDVWNGTIKVGGSSGTTLSPKPLYTNTSLGGGAVGEVPYSCHFGECAPAGTHYGSSGIATATASSTNSVTLWHYGPVEWSGFPYVVSRCSIAEDCIPGLGVVTGFSASGSGTRSVTVSENGHNFEAGYHYHFEPVLSGSNALKCSGINATNVPVRDYTFTVIFN